MTGIRAFVAALAAVALLAFPAAAQKNVVNVYNWSDYIDEAVLKEFEKETGLKVVYDVFDSNELLETKLLAGKSGYDVVVPSATFMSRQIKAGVFRKLDMSLLPNRKHMWDVIQQRVAKYDPGNAYSMNYLWGTTGIGYNEAKIKQRMPNAPVDSWTLVFDPAIISKFADCGIHMLDAPDEMIAAALKHIGEDPASQDPKVIEKALKPLQAIRPHVQKFHSSEYINALANGDICLAVGWSGDIFQAGNRAKEAKKGVEVTYMLPKEGAQMWFDQMAVPADAPHPLNAHRFINYMMKPEVIARSTNVVQYANGNKDSQQFVDKEVLANPSVYPTTEVMARLYTISPLGQKAQRAATSVWTKVKAGK
ncbi:MAG: polyamine ABC transporter substrate-binding protein [Rhodospirillales bacterium]|nr:polyamine ABC transporter substrate-binding protein [Rhodospirillales bacterium]